MSQERDRLVQVGGQTYAPMLTRGTVNPLRRPKDLAGNVVDALFVAGLIVLLGLRSGMMGRMAHFRAERMPLMGLAVIHRTSAIREVKRRDYPR